MILHTLSLINKVHGMGSFDSLNTNPSKPERHVWPNLSYVKYILYSATLPYEEQLSQIGGKMFHS